MIVWIEKVFLRYFNKKYKLSVPESYKDVIDVINSHTFGITGEKKYRYYGYLMKVLKLHLKAECLSILLKKEEQSRDIKIFIPHEGYDRNHVLKKIIKMEDRKVSLNDESLICIPWNAKRMICAVNDITNHGFSNQLDYLNGEAIYYTEMDLCYRFNGTHHAAAGTMISSGEIIAKTYDVSVLFDVVDINDNGEFVSIGEPSKAYQTDYRIALLYYLARERWKMKKNKE